MRGVLILSAVLSLNLAAANASRRSSPGVDRRSACPLGGTAAPRSYSDISHSGFAGMSSPCVFGVTAGILPAPVRGGSMPDENGAADRRAPDDTPKSGGQDAASYGRRGHLPLNVAPAPTRYASPRTGRLWLGRSGSTLLAPTSPGQASAAIASRRSMAADRAISPSDDSVLVPEPGERANRFYRTGNLFWCIRAFWDLFVPALILFTGVSAGLGAWTERIGRKWFFAVTIYIVVFAALKYVLEFPLNCYLGFFRQQAYDLSNQTFSHWLATSFKHLAVEMTVCAGFVWIPYLFMRKSPRRWWLYIWAATTVATVFVVCVAPVWIDPLFNRFGPMKNRVLEADILALAKRAGIEAHRVYEVDKSADTKTVNAYVTGFLKTKRIVLWDTMIVRLNRRELLTVMGHEMGHYVLGHVWQGIMLSAVLTFVGFHVFYRVNDRLINRFRERFGFNRVSNIASWPLILLCLRVSHLALNPFILGFSRHLEHEADRFALEITRDNHAAATAFAKEQAENLSVPRPGGMYKLWRATHPPAGERIDFANSYRPWENGGLLKYGHLFTAPETNRVDAASDL